MRLVASLLVVGLVAALPFGNATLADRLDDLRAAGVVGERYDGYATVRDPAAGSDVKSFVDQINRQRRQHYEGVAKQENAPVSEVGKVYANQIYQAAPRGYWFLTQSGQWRQK